MRCKKMLIFTGLLCFAILLAGCQWREEAPVPTPTPTPTPLPTPEPTPTPTPAPVEIGGMLLHWETEELDLSITTEEAPAKEAAEEEAAPVDAEELAAALRQLPMMHTVDLRGRTFSTDEQLALYEEFPEVSFLWEVDVLGVKAGSEDEYINLDGIPMTDTAALEELLPLLPGVKKIDMCGCGLDNETMYELNQRHEGIEFVWSMPLGNTTLRTDATAFCSNNVGVRVRATSAELMEKMKYFSKLTALDFGHSKTMITDLGWLKWLPNLEILILVGCDVRDVAPIAELEHLTYLELFSCAELVDISPLAQCTKLEHLNLSATKVNDLTPLHGMPNLKRLWLNACPELSTEQVDAFWRATPNCGISYVLKSKGAWNGWRQDDSYFWMRDQFNAVYMPIPEELRWMAHTQWYTPEGEEPRFIPTPAPRPGLVP